MPREQVLSLAEPLLREHGARLAEMPCEALAYDAALGRFVWSGETAHFNDLGEALDRARTWQGVAIYFEYPLEDVLGSLSFILWNDETPTATTVALCENSTLFNLQREHAPSWSSALRLFSALGRELQAPFFTLRCEPPLRTMRVDEVVGDLERINRGSFVPLLLATHKLRFPVAVSVAPHPTGAYQVQSLEDFVVITNGQMGTPDED
jgi:hypothetical protein